MNVTWYYGTNESDINNILGTDLNISNSTIAKLDFNASQKGIRYYWRVSVDDGINFINATYSFLTEGVLYLPSQRINIFSIVGVFGLFAFVFVFIWLRRRKKNT